MFDRAEVQWHHFLNGGRLWNIRNGPLQLELIKVLKLLSYKYCLLLILGIMNINSNFY